MQQNYVAPFETGEAFHCPHCLTFAHQHWGQASFAVSGLGQVPAENCKMSHCEKCKQQTIWVLGRMIHPDQSFAPPPALDMPSNVRQDYQEAASIAHRSPKAAAALLRLAVQKLMPHLGETGDNLNADIKSLVGKGLPVKVQQSLDALRVVGNNAVHPGEISADLPFVANSLFTCLNMIVEAMITQPKALDRLYQTLPPSSRDAIEKRDGKAMA